LLNRKLFFFNVPASQTTSMKKQDHFIKVLDFPNIAAQDDPLRIKQLPKGSAGSLIIERE
jgi:hypothetical protein